MKTLFKRINRWFKIKTHKHVPTFAYCEDKINQDIIKSAFDTCTFIPVE